MRNLLIVSAVLSGIATAQSTPCISLNDATTFIGTAVSWFGFAGPNVTAYQFTPQSVLMLRSAQILTESSAFASPQGYQSLEIWDTNFIFLPQSRLGGGTWQNQPDLGIAWQGADFDDSVVLLPGNTYWLVWRESGGNRLPYEPAGSVVTTATWNGATWSTQATSQAIKWRGFCSLLDGANVAAIGDGCSSSQSRTPTAFTNNEPSVGNDDFQVEASGFPAGAVGLALFGTDPTWISLPVPGLAPGCLLHTDVLATATIATGTGNEQATHATGANGHTWLDFPIPAVPGLVGATIGAQFAVLDSLPAPLPFVLTNGVRFTIF